MPASRPDYCGRRDDWRLQDGRILTATTPTSGMQLVPNTIAMSPIVFGTGFARLSRLRLILATAWQGLRDGETRRETAEVA